MTTFTAKTDYIGAIAGSLCLLHCAITPFIFIAKACTVTCCDASPFWWQILDFVFLIISFFAIYRTTRLSSKNWLKITFWANWFILLSMLMNEQLGYIQLNEKFIYLPAILIVLLHLYNLKYCQCSKKECCISEKLE